MGFKLDSLFNAALRYHQAGELSRAAEGYEAVLELSRDFAPAHHYLGLIAHQKGDPARAVALVQRALKLDPTLLEARYNLGNMFRELGRLRDAERCYRAVLLKEPNNPGALHNLALLLKQRGSREDCIVLLRRLVTATPLYAAGHTELGAALLESDQPEDAVRHLRRAVELAPASANARYNLGRAIFACGDPEQAEANFRAVLRINPGDAAACDDLGRVLLAQHRYNEAIGVYEDLVRQLPTESGYLRRLGLAQHRAGRLKAAIETYKRALADAPRDEKTHTNLGNAHQDQGRVAEAIDAYRRALAIDPTYYIARSNLLFSLCFSEDADPAEVFAEHRLFDELHAEPLGRGAASFLNDRDPQRRLRVAYLSPDFRYHPGGHFLLPPLENHDRNRFEIFAYSTTRSADDFTDRFRNSTVHWHNVAAFSDAGLAQKIREDRIDILMECTGHMAGHRLLVAARRPAPVQISFPLYPNTTGLSAIGYRIADPYFAPPAVDRFHAETLIRLPDTHVCYEPSDRTIQPSETTPSLRNGAITFGSFNNAAKLGERTIALWARLLHAVPRSRLMLKWLGLDDGEQPWFADRLLSLGIGPERLRLMGRSDSPYSPYLDVDICLDPLHANGGTTTCDALWMGVPVITRPGESPFSRVGLCHLTNVGLPELIATDDDSYVRIATELAMDPQRLAAVRTGLRERFARSPLMDGARYTRHLEAAFRRVWMDWCRSADADR